MILRCILYVNFEFCNIQNLCLYINYILSYTGCFIEIFNWMLKWNLGYVFFTNSLWCIVMSTIFSHIQKHLITSSKYVHNTPLNCVNCKYISASFIFTCLVFLNKYILENQQMYTWRYVFIIIVRRMMCCYCMLLLLL